MMLDVTPPEIRMMFEQSVTNAITTGLQHLVTNTKTFAEIITPDVLAYAEERQHEPDETPHEPRAFQRLHKTVSVLLVSHSLKGGLCFFSHPYAVTAVLMGIANGICAGWNCGYSTGLATMKKP